MAVAKPQLWHPDHPWLYTLVSTVKKNGVVCDEVKTRCGLRRLRVTDDGFCLNGEKLVFRGANRHMAYPWLGNAASDNLQYRNIRLLKEGGFNFVRLCHYPQSSATLDACDELGVMALSARRLAVLCGRRVLQKRGEKEHPRHGSLAPQPSQCSAVGGQPERDLRPQLIL